MAFIGNTSTTQAFTPAVDFFSGNGSTTAFTLSRPVASVAQVQAVIANVPQNPSTAFTVNGNTVTFTSAPPTGTNNIYVYYTSPITQVIAPGQGTVGTTALMDNAVTAAKILDANVTQSKLGAGVAGNGPAFSAYSGSAQSVPHATITKVQFPSEEFDTANCFDSTTNYRFTPTIAGYYQVNGNVSFVTTSNGQVVTFIYKNGVRFKDGVWNTLTSQSTGSNASALVYCNGSTDYLEFYVYQTSGGALNTAVSNIPYFQAFLARAA